MMKACLLPPEIEALVRSDGPVAVGVSGGKDSCAAAIAVTRTLDALGHTGDRLLIHADLGRVEWRDSLPTCERLSARLGLELAVVRRRAGGMMERWLSRWKNNVRRYVDLECVKLILPWSTPAMRFCTSELKLAPISSYLVGRFPGRTIISVSGIRRDESPNRAKASIFKSDPMLARKSTSTTGLDWHPILDWSVEDVFGAMDGFGFEPHEAYSRFGSSRVSCAFCILASRRDLVAASRCAENAEVYREMVGLEIESTFAFQDDKWLGDVAPSLLSAPERAAVLEAKEKACLRHAAERRIPKHLFYQKGWPRFLPTTREADLLADVRRAVGDIVGIPVKFTDGASVLRRYRELLSAKSESTLRDFPPVRPPVQEGLFEWA